MLILDLWGISFHAVVVFALGKNLLYKFSLGHCDKVVKLDAVVVFSQGFEFLSKRLWSYHNVPN